jgi:hypothetical protein
VVCPAIRAVYAIHATTAAAANFKPDFIAFGLIDDLQIIRVVDCDIANVSVTSTAADWTTWQPLQPSAERSGSPAPAAAPIDVGPRCAGRRASGATGCEDANCITAGLVSNQSIDV